MGKIASDFELVLTRVPGVRVHLGKEVEHLFFTEMYRSSRLCVGLERRGKYVKTERFS